MPEILIEASVFPTEEPDRIRKAILNLFPDAKGDNSNKLSGKSLDLLVQRIREQKIKDTARNILLKSIYGKNIKFHLNKQAAYTGKINFTEGKSTLGDINITIQHENPEQLIKEMTE